MHVINLKMRAEAESLKPRITNAWNSTGIVKPQELVRGSVIF